MMIKYLVFILVVFFSACNGKDSLGEREIVSSFYVCEDMEKVRQFALSCISGAGRSGDSEPEDWLDKCSDLAERMYCEKRPFKVTYYTGDNVSILVEKSREEIK